MYMYTMLGTRTFASFSTQGLTPQSSIANMQATLENQSLVPLQPDPFIFLMLGVLHKKVMVIFKNVIA